MSATKPSQTEINAQKKQTVLGSAPAAKSKTPLIAALAVAVALVLGAAYLFTDQATGPITNAMGPAVAQAQATEVTYNLTDFNDGKAKYYSYKAPDGITVKYFIIKSSDGVVRAAFDACDVCWRAGRGYTQDGDFMVCNNCGRRFASVQVNEVKGGCNPAPLTRTVSGEKLVIKVSDILEGRTYFNFKKS